ncbi:hypothetical protein PG987_008835 [Apiospora arundinis]
MKATALLPVLLGATSIEAGVVSIRQNGEPKDMDQFAEWQAIHGTCPVYISKTQPKWDRSGVICIEYCKKHGDGQYSSCDQQKLVNAIGRFPSEMNPGDKDIGGTMKDLDGYYYIPSKCECDNPTVEAFTKEVFEIVAKGLSQLDNLLCTMMLKALMTIVEEGIGFIPVGGQVFRGFTTAVKAAKSFAENAGSATDLFQGWIEPACGMPNAKKFNPADTFKQLVETPDEFGMSIGCKRDKKLCKKLPPANPKNKPTKKAEDDKPKPTKTEPAKPGDTTKPPKPTNTDKDKACKLKRAAPELYKVKGDQDDYKRGVRSIECNKGKTTTHEIEITSIKWAPNPAALPVTATCKDDAGQACHHYQSAIHVNPSWKVLTCAGDGATKGKVRDKKSPAVNKFYRDIAKDWRDEQWRVHKDVPSTKTPPKKPSPGCQADEFPPYYLLSETSDAWKEAGKSSKGQLIRYIPHNENGAGGKLWQGKCFYPVFGKYNAQQLWDRAQKHTIGNPKKTDKGDVKKQEIAMEVDYRPTFEIDFKQSNQDAKDAKDKIFGLKTELNKCLPSLSTDHDGKGKFDDPGFALLRFDPYNKDKKRDGWDYLKTKPQKQATPKKTGTRGLWEGPDLDMDGFEVNGTFVG